MILVWLSGINECICQQCCVDQGTAAGPIMRVRRRPTRRSRGGGPHSAPCRAARPTEPCPVQTAESESVCCRANGWLSEESMRGLPPSSCECAVSFSQSGPKAQLYSVRGRPMM